MPQVGRSILVPVSIVATILLGWVLKVGAPIVQPLVIALLLASMLSPLVRLLARLHIPHFVSVLGMAAVLFYFVLQGLFLAQRNVAAFIGEESPPPLAAESESDSDPGAPKVDEPAFAGLVAGIEKRVQSSSLPDVVKKLVLAELDDIQQSGRAEKMAQEFLGSGLAFIRTAILVLIYMLFIFAEQAVFRRKILAVAGDRREDASRILDTIGKGIQRFIGIKTLTSLATGALGYAVCRGFELPYALLFGLLTFLFNFIPYFGSLVAGALPTVTALAIQDDWTTAVVVAILYFAINTIVGSVVEPKIMGRELDLSPLVIIVSVVVWTALWGVVGAFLAVPLMATLQIVLASTETTRPIAVMLSSGPPKDGGRRAARLAS
ncbi:MAG: AI-2E family transporter [Planctomycetota bacterium]